MLKARGAVNDELPFGLEDKDTKLTLMGWEIVPDAYYDQIMDLKNNYGNPDIYLTENGAAYPDLIEKNGEINDTDRIDYFKKYLSAVKKSIDNGAKVKSYKDQSLSEIMKLLEPEDLIKYGLIPEFIGRMPIIATLDDLDEKSLVKILKEPKNSLIKQYQRLFEFEEVKLV